MDTSVTTSNLGVNLAAVLAMTRLGWAALTIGLGGAEASGPEQGRGQGKGPVFVCGVD